MREFLDQHEVVVLRLGLDHDYVTLRKKLRELQPAQTPVWLMNLIIEQQPALLQASCCKFRG